MPKNATRVADLARDIREALAQEGIDSLDVLVNRLAGSAAARIRHEERLLMVAEHAGRSGSDSEAPGSHQPPEMSLLIDGERCEPDVITEFNGRALYSTPGVDAKGEPALYSFTALKLLAEHLGSAARADRSDAAVLHDIGTTNPDSLSPIARYFEHEDQGGDRLENNPGFGWRDLTRVSRGFLGLSDWNDIISAVDWCRWDISLYEHVNFGGSQLYLPAGQTYNHLSAFGWNDRASATTNWGTRF